MIILLSTLAILGCEESTADSQTAPPSTTAACVGCTGVEEDIAALQAQVDSLENRLDSMQSGLDEVNARLDALENAEPPPSAVVVSEYMVDCNRVTLYDRASAEMLAARTAGLLDGFEYIYTGCPLVEGVVGSMPAVTVAQVRELDIDATCGVSACENTSANGWWYNSNSGGYIAAGGWDDMRMSPGMQLRFDDVRGVVYTVNDYRSTSSGSTDPLWYAVTVVGDKAYTAPTGWY